MLMAKATGIDLVSPALKSDTRLSAPAAPPMKVEKPAAQTLRPAPAASAAAHAGAVSKPVETATLVVKMAAPKAVAPVGPNVAVAPTEPVTKPAGVLMAKAQTLATSASPALRREGTLVALKPVEALRAVTRTIRAISRAIRLRFAFEGAGGTVAWNHLEKTVHAVTRTNDVKVKIGSPIAVVNGKRINMGKAAYIRGGRTMVPIDFITKALRMTAK